MRFKGWRKTSLIEYPEKISTVLFKGLCNFRCPFCYNPELVLRPGAIPDIESEDVLAFLRENKALYQAVVVTGGEPTLDSELPLFFRKVKELGYAAGLETNGTNPEMLELIFAHGLVDFAAMDIKAPLNLEAYSRAAGLKGGSADSLRDGGLFCKVLESVQLIRASKVDYEFRTTFVPGIHQEQDILSIAEHLKGSNRFVLQQFVPGNTLEEHLRKTKPYPQATLLKVYERIKEDFKSCEVRNI